MGKLTGIQSHGRPRRKWEDIIKEILIKEVRMMEEVRSRLFIVFSGGICYFELYYRRVNFDY
jgi:hypothetical protein